MIRYLSTLHYTVQKFFIVLCLHGFSGHYGYMFITCCSKEVEEARAALHDRSASVEQLQSQMKEMQEQLNNEEKAREHARMLQRLASCFTASLYNVLYITNCSRWKSFMVAELNCNSLEDIHCWTVLLHG